MPPLAIDAYAFISGCGAPNYIAGRSYGVWQIGVSPEPMPRAGMPQYFMYGMSCWSTEAVFALLSKRTVTLPVRLIALTAASYERGAVLQSHRR